MILRDLDRMSICLTRTINHGWYCFHTAPPPLHQRTLIPQGISLGTLNIHDGWGYGLAQAIQELHIGSFDLMILTETKITDQDYCLRSLGYDVV